MRRPACRFLGVCCLVSGLLSLSSAAPCAESDAPPIEIAVPPTSWIAQARPGDWTHVRLRLSIGEGREAETVQKTTVLRGESREGVRVITIKRETESGGNRDVLTQVYRVEPGQVPAPAPARVAEEPRAGETVTVGEKRLECGVSERAEPDGTARILVRTWTCLRVPFGGTVRIEHNGRRVYELLDFGRGE